MQVVSTLTSILTDMAIPAYQELVRSGGVNASLELFYDIGVFFIALHFDKLYNGSSFTNYIIPHLIFPTNPSSDDVLMIVKNILPQRYEFRNLDSVVHMSQSGVCDQYNRIVRPLLKFYLLYFKTSTPSRSLVFRDVVNNSYMYYLIKIPLYLESPKAYLLFHNYQQNARNLGVILLSVCMEVC